MHESKWFGRYLDDSNNEKSRPEDYSKGPEVQREGRHQEDGRDRPGPGERRSGTGPHYEKTSRPLAHPRASRANAVTGFPGTDAPAADGRNPHGVSMVKMMDWIKRLRFRKDDVGGAAREQPIEGKTRDADGQTARAKHQRRRGFTRRFLSRDAEVSEC
jgi:hypothetical protein